MKKLFIILLLLPFLGGCISSSALFGLSVVTTAIDAYQTSQIVRAPDLYETNPILGKAPTDLEIGLYFGAWTALNYGIEKSKAPGWVKKAYFVLYNAVELACIGNNIALGVRF